MFCNHIAWFKDVIKYPLGASVPSLGLSNKAVSEDDCKNTVSQPKKKDYPEHYFIPLTLNGKFLNTHN